MIDNFRFWCQKVLPTVYDDSLSYYELLCKVVNYLNQLIDSNNNLEKELHDFENTTNSNYAELKSYVENYFNNLDVQAEINKKLDEMAASGALGNLLIEALNLRMSADRKQRFQDSVRKCVASYLFRNYGGTYFASGGASPANDKKMVVKYANATTWQAYRWGSTPVYTDKQVINGVEYNVMYCDCSSFGMLIYNSILYDDSPYLYGFEGGEVNSDEMILKGFPDRLLKKDYTIDFNSLTTTKNMPFILTQSGLTPVLLSTRKSGADVIYSTNNLNTLETGDIIFSGSGPDGGTIYELTGHCLVYIKTLDELNVFSEQYGGAILKAVDDDEPTWGYVVEVTYSSEADNDYTNCLKIGTLKHHMDRALTRAQNITYAFKLVANAVNSNPGSQYYTGIWRDYNKLYFKPVASDNPLESKINFNVNTGAINAWGVGAVGVNMSRDMDANTLAPGTWRCTSSAVLPTIQNIPLNANYFILQCDGVTINNNFYGTQTFKIFSASSPYVYVRCCNNGKWSPWKRLAFSE